VRIVQLRRVTGGLVEVVDGLATTLNEPFTVSDAVARNTLRDGSGRFEPADAAAEALFAELEVAAAPAPQPEPETPEEVEG
jgi:hypothetical protein